MRNTIEGKDLVVVASILSVIFLHAAITIQFVVGDIVTIAGVIIIQRK
jgi:uncharacterized membrane protein